MKPKEFFDEVRNTFDDIFYCGIINEDEVFYEDYTSDIDKEAHESIVMRLYFLATDPEKNISYFITQYAEGKYLYIKKIDSNTSIFIFSSNRSFAKLHFFVQFILSEDDFELAHENPQLSQNTEFTDKMMSARRIQELLLPDIEQHLTIFQDRHLWYQPKDLVGGDFYWLKKTKDQVWMVVGDCTGHSVEGALSSVSVMSILNQVFDPEIKPHKLIKSLHRSLDNLQEQKLESGYGIGCEMIAICFDLKNKELTYAGTGLPLYRISNEKVQKLKTKKSALNPERVVKYLRSRKIYFEKSDGFFTHSDGLFDQLNLAGKKIQSRSFLELLKKKLKVDDQITKELVEKHLNGQPRVDDIVSLYVKV